MHRYFPFHHQISKKKKKTIELARRVKIEQNTKPTIICLAGRQPVNLKCEIIVQFNCPAEFIGQINLNVIERRQCLRRFIFMRPYYPPYNSELDEWKSIGWGRSVRKRIKPDCLPVHFSISRMWVGRKN